MVVDMDTNKDGKLDTSDIKSLHLSTMGGDAKISPDFEELIDWKLTASHSGLYFRTVEDIKTVSLIK
jgi:hypothetical protein